MKAPRAKDKSVGDFTITGTIKGDCVCVKNDQWKYNDIIPISDIETLTDWDRRAFIVARAEPQNETGDRVCDAVRNVLNQLVPLPPSLADLVELNLKARK